MNINDARKMLSEARSELESKRKEYEALQAVITGLDQWLSIHEPVGKQPSPGVLPLDIRPSLRSAILQALKESGKPMHVKAIFARATQLGAVSGSKTPHSITDLTIIGLVKIGVVKKTAPRTYQYVA